MAKAKQMSLDQLKDLLRKEIASAGGMRAWSRERGANVSAVSQLLLGSRPSAKIIEALGYEPVTIYVRKAAQ